MELEPIARYLKLVELTRFNRSQSLPFSSLKQSAMTDEIEDYDEDLLELEDEIARGIKQLQGLSSSDEKIKVFFFRGYYFKLNRVGFLSASCGVWSCVCVVVPRPTRFLIFSSNIF